MSELFIPQTVKSKTTYKDEFYNKSFVVVGANESHEGSICLIVDGKLECIIEEERFTKHKYSGGTSLSSQAAGNVLSKIKKGLPEKIVIGVSRPATKPTKHGDVFSLADKISQNLEFPLVRGDKLPQETLCTNFEQVHHDTHAYGAFVRSGFDDAMIVVSDGTGSILDIRLDEEDLSFNGSENFSIYTSNVNLKDKTIDLVVELKRIIVLPRTDNFEFLQLHFENLNRYYESFHSKEQNPILHMFSTTKSPGELYQYVAEYFYGLTMWDSGKIMGLSSYGEYNPNINWIVDDHGEYHDEHWSEIFEHMHNEGADLPLHLFCANHEELHRDDWVLSPENTPKEYKDMAYMVQSRLQEVTYARIKKYLEVTQKTSVVLTGGYFHNVVANYYIRKKLDEDYGPGNIKLFVDPICHDAGNSHGAAIQLLGEYKLFNDEILKDKALKLNSLYLGLKYDYSIEDLYSIVKKYEKLDDEGSIEIQDTSFEEVAKLIQENNIVSIYQGRSEVGPRALGNRSILYNPCDPNGRDQVNTVKRREWFRPFAGTVLHEYVHDWFDMASLDESPFMMYAVDTYKDKIDKIPAIVHVDGTCRLQTLKEDQNPNYYKLIKCFHDLTDIPMVLNTSFNVAGDTMVETLDDAINTLCRSKIEYLFLPEFMKLVKCTKYFYKD